MIPVKRIEIVVDGRTGRRVTEILDGLDLTGWTRLRNASGSGDRGRRHADELTGVASNLVFVTTCTPEQLDGVVAALRPVLEQSGGMCLVSDALWVLH
ncbi:MAG: transcriptional regulator [Planctomycetota bacterium]